MQFSKFDPKLSEALARDPSWLMNAGRKVHYTVFVTTEDDKTYTGEWTAAGLAELSSQGWVKSIRAAASMPYEGK